MRIVRRVTKGSARAVALVGLVLAPSCGPRPRESAWPGAVCRVRLPNAPARPAVDVPDAPTPRSRIVVDATVDIAKALARAESALPRVVADASDIDTGDGSRLSLKVERGDFSLDLDDSTPRTRVGVRVPLRGTAALCRPLGPMGCVELARCRPEATASAHLVPLLDAEYRFPSPSVSIDITKRCTLTAFAIDVTPRLQAEANAQAEILRARIDAALPEVREPIQPLWELLGTTITLGRDTCARLVPTDVVQTGARVRGGLLRGGVGVEGQLSLESPCRGPSPKRPLPPPVFRQIDKHTDDRGIDLRVPVVVPWDEVSRATARSLDTVEVVYGASLVHVIDARVSPGENGSIQIVATLAGDTCGEIVLTGKPVWSTARNAIGVGSLRATSATDATALARAIEAALRVPLPVDITSLGSTVRKTLDALVPKPTSKDEPTVVDHIGEAGVELVVPAKAGLAAVVVARGEVEVQISP